MKILQVHNFYQNPGGEDRVYAAEFELLTSRGHEVIQYQADNDSIREMSGLTAAVTTHWSSQTYREICRILRQERPDIVHAHNTFPLISPSVYYAAAAERVPVVQTLHNYRLICPGANLFRDGHVCEDCVGSFVPYRAVLHRCYRGSLSASVVTTSMLSGHRFAGTFVRKVCKFITLTNFARTKFIEGGLPAQKIVVKPNFLGRDPGVGNGRGAYAFFAARICEEKGTRTLLKAWRSIDSKLELIIAGDGPLLEWGQEYTKGMRSVRWLGRIEYGEVMNLTRHAMFLVCPSLYQEGGPLTIIEALGCGTPVVASDLDSMNEFVVEGVNGLRFRAGDPDHLAERVSWLLGHPDLLSSLRRAARISYQENYTADRNYALLTDIYRRAVSDYS